MVELIEKRRKLKTVVKFVREHPPETALLLMLAIAAVVTNGIILRVDNFLVLLSRSSLIGIIALGQSLVIISGAFDLSVASLVAVAVSGIAIFSLEFGLGLGLIIAMGLVVALGVTNGLLVSKAKIPSFIVTLGMSMIGLSIARQLAFGRVPAQYDIYRIGASFFDFLPYGSLIFPIFVWIIIIFLCYLILHRATVGRYIYALGASEKTSRLSGVPVDRIRILVFAFSGLLCGIAAIVYLYRFGGAPVDQITIGLLLDSIAAVVVGGVYLYGGEGRITGVVAGVLIIALLENTLAAIGLDPYFRGAVKGALILGAAFVYLAKRVRKE